MMHTCWHVNLTLLGLTGGHTSIVKRWRCDDCGHTFIETSRPEVRMFGCNGNCIDCPNWEETGESSDALYPVPVVIPAKL